MPGKISTSSVEPEGKDFGTVPSLSSRMLHSYTVRHMRHVLTECKATVAKVRQVLSLKAFQLRRHCVRLLAALPAGRRCRKVVDMRTPTLMRGFTCMLCLKWYFISVLVSHVGRAITRRARLFLWFPSVSLRLVGTYAVEGWGRCFPCRCLRGHVSPSSLSIPPPHPPLLIAFLLRFSSPIFRAITP